MMILKAVKKPLEIEAMKLVPSNNVGILNWVENHGSRINILNVDGIDKYFLPTLEGEMEAKTGDFIIRGIKGEFYFCRSDIFYESYNITRRFSDE